MRASLSILVRRQSTKDNRVVLITKTMLLPFSINENVHDQKARRQNTHTYLLIIRCFSCSSFSSPFFSLRLHAILTGWEERETDVIVDVVYPFVLYDHYCKDSEERWPICAQQHDETGNRAWACWRPVVEKRRLGSVFKKIVFEFFSLSSPSTWVTDGK